MSSPRVSTPFRNLALAAATTLFFGGLVEGLARYLEPPPVQKEEYLWDWSERFKDGDFYTLEKGEGYPPNEEYNVDGLRDVTRPVETRDSSSVTCARMPRAWMRASACRRSWCLRDT